VGWTTRREGLRSNWRLDKMRGSLG
jgi:hypothetical protein